GQELAGRRRVEFHGSAGEPTPASHRERHRAPAAVVDVGSEIGQRLQQRGHGPAPDGRIAVEVNGPRTQSGQRRCEPSHRPRVAQGDLYFPVTVGHRLYPHTIGDGVRVRAECVECPEHETRVPGIQRIPHERLPGGQGSEYEGAVRDGLRSGYPDGCIEPFGGRRGGPGVLLTHGTTVPHRSTATPDSRPARPVFCAIRWKPVGLQPRTTKYVFVTGGVASSLGKGLT